jgi:hypothetical protein
MGEWVNGGSWGFSKGVDELGTNFYIYEIGRELAGF